MNIAQLQGFVFAAQTDSITQAAKLAYISQPAMTKLIHQLEKELGVQLFDRTGRTIQLNAQGQLFFSYVTIVLDQLQKGIDAVTTKTTNQLKPIRLLVEVASSLIPEIIHIIQQHFPAAPVQLTQRISTLSEPRQFDFIISSRQPQLDRTAIPLLNEEILVGSAQPQFKSQYVTPAELQRLPVIGLGRHNPLRDTIDSYFEALDIHLNYQYEADDPATIRELLLSGAGIGFIPAVTWQKVGRQLHLARIISNPPFRTIYLTENQQTESNVARIVANALVELFVAERKRSLKI